MHFHYRAAIIFLAAISINTQARAGDANPPIDNSSFTTFDFTAPSYFNAPVWSTGNVGDNPTLARYQETDIEDNGQGYKIIADVTQCITFDYGPTKTCAGMNGTQGAWDLTLVSLIQATRFKSVKMHISVPEVVSVKFGVVVDVDLDNADGDPLSILQCTSSWPITSQGTNEFEFNLSAFPAQQIELDFTCNKNLKKVVFESVEKYPGMFDASGTYHAYGNPSLLTSIAVSSAPGYQLQVQPLDGNGSNLGAAATSAVQSESTMILPLGAHAQMTLQDPVTGETIPATYSLVGTPSFSPAISADDQSKGLYMDRLGILFGTGAQNSQDSIWVHMGTQSLVITPSDSTKPSVTITVNVSSPTSLGSKNLTYDNLAISYAHIRGIPPQFIKGEIAQESTFDPNGFRYEPYSIDKAKIFSGKAKYPGSFSKYLFGTTANPLLTANLIHPRSKFGYYSNGVIRAIPDNYESTVVAKRYTPLMCSSIMAINNNGAIGWIGYHWDQDIDAGMVKEPLSEIDHDNLLFNYLKQNNYPNILSEYSDYNFTAQTVVASSYGLMQVLYTTASSKDDGEYEVGGIGLDPAGLKDPSTNLKVGSLVLRKKYKVVNGSIVSYADFKTFVDKWRKAFQKYNGVAASSDSTSLDDYNFGVWTYSLLYFPVGTLSISK